MNWLLDKLKLHKEQNLKNTIISILDENIGEYNEVREQYKNEMLAEWSYYKKYWEIKGVIRGLMELSYNEFNRESSECDVDKILKGE